MPYLMGVDLGTSSVKAMVMDPEGRELSLAGEKYAVAMPRPRWAEQDPEMWWDKAADAIGRAVERSGVAPDEITAVGFSGQMHGLVCLTGDGAPVRPAIIWLDKRTDAVIGEIYARLGPGFVAGRTLNGIDTGFMLASLYWLKKYEPENYERTEHILLPKDYIKYKLSGVMMTDFSDAAATLAYDNLNLRWADELLLLLDLEPDLLPPAAASTTVLGQVHKGAAKRTGLSRSTLVVNGGADQAMQAIGNGIAEEGVVCANIGTGGQVSVTMGKPVFDPELRTNTFAHALPGRWYIMGAVLASGASLKWLSENILDNADFARLDEGAAKIRAGSDGLVFLPYLAGERAPHLDPKARGVFFGLTLGHTRYHMARAVMEGVVFSFRDCLDLITGLKLPCRRLVASGGGAKSRLWLQMLADVLEMPAAKSAAREQACLGAAMTAGVGSGLYANFAEACGRAARMEENAAVPDAAVAAAYREAFGVYRDVYAATKNLFPRLENFS